MIINETTKTKLEIPNGFIIFISGVPGSGKTTLSYELFKKYNEFRIIEETDIIREILRGYNKYIISNGLENYSKLPEISSNKKLLTFQEAKEQCRHMKNSLENIVLRQKRREISTIINGVHIIPEILNGLFQNQNVIYINLYLSSEEVIKKRIQNRNSHSYMLDHTSLIYNTNVDLFMSTCSLSEKNASVFYNIDVTSLSENSVITEAESCIYNNIMY